MKMKILYIFFRAKEDYAINVISRHCLCCLYCIPKITRSLPLRTEFLTGGTAPFSHVPILHVTRHQYCGGAYCVEVPTPRRHQSCNITRLALTIKPLSNLACE
jgi:hypothetical protein